MQYSIDNDNIQNAQDESQRIARVLGEQPRRRIMIRPDTPDGGEPWVGCINGHIFRIARGIEVEVPESLATLIAQNSTVEELGQRALEPYRGERGKRIG